jgi:hypothetical protein
LHEIYVKTTKAYQNTQPKHLGLFGGPFQAHVNQISWKFKAIMFEKRRQDIQYNDNRRNDT